MAAIVTVSSFEFIIVVLVQTHMGIAHAQACHRDIF